MDINTIKIQEGIHNIRFGMSKNCILNQINSKHIEEADEFGDMDIFFPKLNLRFGFWKEYNYKLGCISSERIESTLLGVQMIGSEKASVRKFISTVLNSTTTEANGCKFENGDIIEWIEVDHKSLTFWFLNDSLYQICWCCRWVNNDTPDW